MHIVLLILFKLTCQAYWHRRVSCCLVVFCALWTCQSAPIQATEDSRAPLVLLGHVDSGKNYTAADLLGARFSQMNIKDAEPLLIIADDEKKRIKEKFNQPLPDLSSAPLTPEKTILYDHETLHYPFYNVLGFGEPKLASTFGGNKYTEEVHKSLKKIFKKPIKGLVLHVDYYQLVARKKSTILDVMDILFPYFENAETIKRDLSPSVCLVITGFIKGMWFLPTIQQKKEEACYLLRESMVTCYTAFNKAEKGTETYTRLSKKKALYDIFLQNPEAIKANEKNNFNANDFKLNLEKIIFFDPEMLLDSGATSTVDLGQTELYKALGLLKLASFADKVPTEDIPEKTKLKESTTTETDNPDGGKTPYLSAAAFSLPVVLGVLSHLNYRLYRSRKKKNNSKPPSRPKPKKNKLPSNKKKRAST